MGEKRKKGRRQPYSHTLVPSSFTDKKKKSGHQRGKGGGHLGPQERKKGHLVAKVWLFCLRKPLRDGEEVPYLLRRGGRKSIPIPFEGGGTLIGRKRARG